MGDVYMHIPRGSNNRLNEPKNGGNNANRLFDSQNNDNGGYNVGDKLHTAAETEEQQSRAIYFQSGKTGVSELTVEWWTQHGCGKKDENDANWIDCQIILQYMCQDSSSSILKNGMSTDTPRHNEANNIDNETFEQKE